MARTVKQLRTRVQNTPRRQTANRMIASYHRRIETLEREVGELRSLLGVDRPAPRIFPRAKVRALIKQFFSEHDGKVIYPSDVAEALNLSYETVERAIVELETDGKIAKA